MCKKLLIFLITASFLFASVALFSKPVHAAYNCELVLNGFQPGQTVYVQTGDSLEVFSNNVTQDGRPLSATRDGEYYIRIDYGGPDNQRFSLPQSVLSNGTLSQTIPDPFPFPGRSHTISLVKDNGFGVNHETLCTARSRVETVQEACTINPQVTTNPNGSFNLAATINTTALIPGVPYILILDHGLARQGGHFTVAPGETQKSVKYDNGGQPLDPGWAGGTYDLYVKRRDCIEIAGGSCAISGCITSVTFSPTAPTLGPSGIVAPSSKPIGEINNAIERCSKSTPEGNINGIKTVFGCVTTRTSDFVTILFQGALGIAGGIAFLLILLGGLKILTSAGNPEGLAEGREIITSAIVGLLLIIFSVFVLRFIGVDILAIPGFS